MYLSFEAGNLLHVLDMHMYLLINEADLWQIYNPLKSL